MVKVPIVRDDEDITTLPEGDVDQDTYLSWHWKRRMYWCGRVLPPNIHAVVAYVFGVEPRTYPARMAGKATITSDGYVMCSVYDPYGEPRSGAFIGSLRT